MNISFNIDFLKRLLENNNPIIDNQITRYKSILANIEKERKVKSKPIEIYDDDFYS